MRKNTAGPSKNRRLSLQLAGALLLPSGASAVSGTQAASFLDVPVGGRPAALGGAYSALAEDAYAPVWNPGGLGFARRTQVAAMHLAYVDSMAYEFVSVSQALPKNQGIGAGVQYFRFGGHYAAYSLSYGRQLTPKAAVGGAAKLIDARSGEVGGRGYGFDLGTMYKMDERTTLAGVLSNLGSRVTFSGRQERLPTTARAGATYWPFPRTMNFSLEGVYANATAGVRSGVEVKLLKMFFIRAGVDTTQAAARQAPIAGGVTAGVGLELGGQQFDYAWVPRGNLGSTNYFSIVARFGMSASPSARAVSAPAPTAQDRSREDYEQKTDGASPPLLWLDN